MRGGVKMFRGVLIWRRVTATDMTARQTKSQVDPGRTDLQALLTAVRARNGFGINPVKMRALLVHDGVEARRNDESRITNHESRITNHESLVTGH